MNMTTKRLRRLLMGTGLSLGCASVAVNCGASNDKLAKADGPGFNASGGVSGTSTGGGPVSATSGDTGGGEAASAGSAGLSDQCAGAEVYQASWTDHSGEGPGPRLSHAMADTPGGIVMFGGGTLLLGGLDDTWVYEQGEWRESESDQSPPSRAGHDMVFGDGEVFLFGGDGGDLLNDIWRYAGDSWDQLCADESCGEPPPARSGLAISYDSMRDKLVLFGGFDGDVALQDTWEWDPTEGWQQICGNDCTSDFCCEPPPRHDHRMVYDSSKHRILMFGGTNDESEFDDVWAYDASGWYAIEAAGPSARAGHTLAFDSTHNLALLFGGMQAGSAVADEAWVFDAQNDAWARLESRGAAPAGREFAALSFDRENQEFVLFGGGDSGQYQDTWTMSFDGDACIGAGGAAGAAGAAGDSGN